METKKTLGIDDILFNEYWPSPQPQWDAIGISKDGTIILVEAKAHPDEIDENGRNSTGDSGKSLKLIKKRIKETFGIDDSILYKKYYQLTNRYCFLNKLLAESKKVELIYLYFINDVSYKPSSKAQYESYLDRGFRKDVIVPKHLLKHTHNGILY